MNDHQILERAEARPVARGFVPSLVSIMKSGRALITLRLAEIGLHPGQDHMLMALPEDGPPVLVSELANTLGVRSSTASKMLDRLEFAGLVRRSNGPSDRRHTIVHLTAKGNEVRKQVEELWAEVEFYILRGVSDEEAEAMCQATERLDALMSERLRRLR